jgi:hypothetical protein
LTRPGVDAEVRGGADQHLLEIADVAVDVLAIRLEIDDRVADQLPRTVEGHVAAAAGLVDLDALRRERAGVGADVGGRAARPDAERDDGGMLDEQQRVVDLAGDALLDQRLLELDAGGVVDPPDPADDQPSHTAAGSKCSIRSLTSAMN